MWIADSKNKEEKRVVGQETIFIFRPYIQNLIFLDVK